MIINHRYKFIFIHIQKTAGTSITNSLFELPETKHLHHPHSKLNTIDLDNYKDYIKFCFVRNPFDRLVSWYNMILQKGIHNDWSKYILENSNSFSEFLDLTEVINETNSIELISEIEYPKSISHNQIDYITDKSGNIQSDFIGRFENINEDFAKISDMIGFKYLSLPYLNSFNHKQYRNYYKDSDIEKVYNLYKKDIDYFNYHF